MLVHYDLFAGIGGFSLAVDEVFHNEPIIHIFSEWESFPTAVLKRHWPNDIYYGDIADLVADLAHSEQRRQGRRENISTRYRQLYDVLCQGAPSILTGGFPCQPFSLAGHRRGTADDRYKWPEMLAVIRHVQPTWVLAENVPGLATWHHGVVLEQVCADLESAGYDVQPLRIPACAVNAPHKRDRLWILACQTAAHPAGLRGQVRERDALRPLQPASESPDAQRVSQYLAERHWDRDWRQVAAELCRVDDGLPTELDGHPLSTARSRQEQLKAYGNAIVPQVAIMILRAIKETGYLGGAWA
jgi:DNA (cytosine-5)-methyltransferase 1